MDSRSRKPPFLKGFLQNINALEFLFDDLHLSYDIEWLATRYLSQDFIETVYSQTKALCGNNIHPNVTNFRPAIRNVMVQQMSKISKSANCELEDIENVIDPETFQRAEKQVLMQNESMNMIVCEDEEEPAPYLVYESFKLDVVQMGIVKYVTGYAIRDIKHEPCKANLTLDVQEDEKEDETNRYILSKKYKEDSQLVIPSIGAFTIGLNVNKVFQNYFHKLIIRNRVNVKTRMKYLLPYNQEIEELCCEICFDAVVTKLLNSFINGRIKLINDAKKVPKNKATGGSTKRNVISKKPTATNIKAKRLNIN